jgi:hypothetical protein
MNRKERRAHAALAPADIAQIAEGCSWKRTVDPEDERYVIVTVRVPNAGQGEEQVVGAPAMQRLFAWASSLMKGSV